MTVQELINKLSVCDPGSKVVIASDSEGNRYDYLYSVDTRNYNFDKHENEIGLRNLLPEHISQGYGEEDLLDGEKCVVLWP